jgi:hypothetical protein
VSRNIVAILFYDHAAADVVDDVDVGQSSVRTYFFL